MKYFYLFFLLLFCSTLFGQDFNNFTTLQSKGELPNNFTTLSSDKYYTDKANNSNKKLDKDFFISTRFFLDKLFLSGKVLFNEPLSNYVNDVANYALSSNHNLFNQLEFYVIKSTVANAFCTDQGVIMFTTGLLAQVENEAQLAYVICHEASHFTKNHIQNSYIERKSIAKGNQRFKQIDYDAQIKKLSIYDKKNEFEADTEGLKIYLETNYAKDEVISSLNMLLGAHLPFDTKSFDHTFFNSQALIIPETYFSDSVKTISLDDNYDDENSTHPNIKKRKDKANEYLKDKVVKGNLKFKHSKERFYNIRDLARFEMMNLWLSQRAYIKVISGVYLLKSKYQNNKFLDLCFIKALYGLAKYKHADRYKEVVRPIEEAEEGYFDINFLFNKLSEAQLYIIAFRHAYNMTIKYPDEMAFQNYFNNLKEGLLNHSIVKSNQIKFEPYEFSSDKNGGSGAASEDSIYHNDFHLYGLSDLIESKAALKKLGVNSLYIEKETTELNQDKVIITDPFYKVYFPNGEINFLSSEHKKLNLTKAFQVDYKDIETEVAVLDSKTLRSNDLNTYNELGVLFQWFNEVILHGDLNMITSINDQVSKISQKKETNHFIFSGVLATQERHKLNTVHILGFLSVAGIPIVTYDLIKKNNQFDLFLISLNTDTDSIEIISIDTIDFSNSEMIIKLCVYNALYSIKNN